MNNYIDKQTAIDTLIKEANKDGACGYVDAFNIAKTLNAMPSVDAVKVVRCWNCIWWDNCPSSTITPNFHRCKRVGRMSMPSDGYCSYGKENKK